ALPPTASALDRLLSLGMIPLHPKAAPSSGGESGGRHHTVKPRGNGGGHTEEAPGVLARVTPDQAYQEAANYLKTGQIDAGVKRLREAAEGGHREAQFAMATYFLMGTGVPVSIATANNYYEKAAKQGHAQAAYNIGISYYNGDGMP